MKIHDLDPEIILKVNINCSNSCPRKLEKHLMEISGVYTVVIDPEMSFVTVRGKVDPMIVLNAIRETGHSAELFSYKKQPMIEDDEKCSEKRNEHVRRRQTGRSEKRKHGLPENHHHHYHRSYHYKAEDSIPPKIDLETYMDPFYKHHRRRPIITNSRVPPWDSFTHHPHHAHGFLCHHGSPFDYHHPSRPRILPVAYGLHIMRRPLHGFNNFITYLG